MRIELDDAHEALRKTLGAYQGLNAHKLLLGGDVVLLFNTHALAICRPFCINDGEREKILPLEPISGKLGKCTCRFMLLPTDSK